MMRAQAGSPDGVTKASITPETSSTATSPSATVTAARPSSASAWLLGRGPGSITVHPSRRPVAAARNTADSSRIPCGRMSAKNSTPLPWAIISAPATPMFAEFWYRTRRVGSPSRIPKISDSAATRALLVHTSAANEGAAYCE